MIEADMAQLLNRQLNSEFFSAYLYLGLAAHAESMGLRGVGAWFMAKYHEEMQHGMKFYQYLMDQGARVELSAIEQPPGAFEGVVDMLEKTLAHEQLVTGQINALVGAALDSHDHATHIFLHWFVSEQIEEEATVKEVLDRMHLFGAKGEGLLLLDQEMEAKAQAIRAGLSAESA